MEKEKIQIVIADDEPIVRMDMKEYLQGEGYDVVGEAADGFDAVEICKQRHPDLALLDIKMPLLDGLSAAHIIRDENLAGAIVLLTAYSETEFIESAKALQIEGYLVKPISEKSLIPSLELAIVRSREVKRLRMDIKKVTERLENRTAIERAKGLVMREDNVSEQVAYDYIRRLSQEKGLSMRRVAEIIMMKAGG